jgi:hypothetical protein
MTAFAVGSVPTPETDTSTTSPAMTGTPEEIAAAEKKNAEEKKLANEQAVKQAERNLASFTKTLEAADAANLIQSVSLSDAKTITITVKNLWHIRNKQIRYQDAQTLWQVWASISSPSDQDKARISIVDFNGNEVGGSRWLGGSVIWVQD